MPDWDPGSYQPFADERGRPFADLLSRVPGTPNSVVDLGCGPGTLTAGLTQRWPGATVCGVDSSEPMIEAARRLPARPGLRFEHADLRSWTTAAPLDLVLSNAALQWVPDHRRLFGHLLEMLTPTGVLAFQVPGNFTAPSHQLLYELSAEPRFATWTADVERPDSAEPLDYVADLSALGCRVEAWETTYLHVLHGADPVFAWISGTGARPILQALPEPERTEFETEFGRRLRAAYPARPYGTVLPFRRIFVVAQRT